MLFQFKACQAGGPGRASVPVLIQEPTAGEFSLLVGLSVLIRPSTDWMRPSPIMKGNLLYSKSTSLNVSLIQKHPHRNTQKNVWPTIWALRPSEFTHKINHNSYYKQAHTHTYTHKQNRKRVLARMWRNENTCALLVGIYNSELLWKIVWQLKNQ